MNLKNLEDLTLVEKIKKGDNLALNTFYYKYYKYLNNKYRGRVRNNEDREEIVDDGLIKFFRNIHNYNKDLGAPKTFIICIMENNLKDNYRKNNSKGKNLIDKSREIETIEELLPGSLEEDLDKLYRSNLLRKEINQLPTANQACMRYIDLYYFKQLKYKEIVKLTKKTQGNVKILIHRGREKLKKELLKKYPKEFSNLYK